jgi:phage terminase large subunit-like protein
MAKKKTAKKPRSAPAEDKPSRSAASRTRTAKRRGWKRLLCLLPGYDPYKNAEAFYFDEDAAQLALDFFTECLTHAKGELAGQPVVLEPWEQSIIANAFGWKRRSDGTRRYRKVFVFVPRKNGKTTLVAGIVLLGLFVDGEPGAEVYSAAAEKDQAKICFDIAKSMTMGDKDLCARAEIYLNSIVLKGTNSFYKPLSADAHTKHGYNAHFVVIDELHAQPNRNLVDVLETSVGSRRQPMIIYITTSDYERESICNEVHGYACKVRDGLIDDPHFLPAIYEASRDDDWTSEATWKKANPNYGVSLKPEYMRAECEKAKNTPSYENTFKRLMLNIRTEQARRWLQMDKWDACPSQIDLESLRGRPCYGGLDLANISDIASFALAFPEEVGYTIVVYNWAPEDTAEEREMKQGVPYLTWGKQGFIELTPGNSIDYRYIRKRINEISKIYNLIEIAYDPWNATHIATELGEEDGFKMIQFRQGFQSMNEPSKEMERLVMTGILNHGGNPVLRWQASNVSAKSDPAGNIKPDKESSSDKIDGIVASIMAIGRAMVTPDQVSVYSTRGIEFI